MAESAEQHPHLPTAAGEVVSDPAGASPRPPRHRFLSVLCALVVFVLTLFAGASVLEVDLHARAVDRERLLELSVATLNNSLRYTHTTWWQSEGYSYETTQVACSLAFSQPTSQTIEILTPAGGFKGEDAIRTQAMALYATAIAIHDNMYDAHAVNVPTSDARRRAVAWANGLAASYDRTHWGDGWQSALWVYYLGFGSRQLWNDLPAGTQQLVTQEVAEEADRLLGIAPRYYEDASDTVLTPGDSKAEEDAWNANLLLFAAREFADEPNAAKWERRGRWYALAAWATRDEIGSDPRIEGSNLNDDGTVTNHGKVVNPDYMFSDAEFIAYAALTAADTHTSLPMETTNNFRRVWRGLTAAQFATPTGSTPASTIYLRGENRSVSADIYYPLGADWSWERRANAALMDCEAFAEEIDPEAADWAVAHLTYVLQQQARHDDGRVFSQGESRYPADEQFAAVLEAVMAARLATMR